jgi:F0F1-type ATP synthase membrane subunit a
LIFLITCLEFLIASLQSYVYIVLLSMYLNEVINPH